jgi:hypothetical protein
MVHPLLLLLLLLAAAVPAPLFVDGGGSVVPIVNGGGSAGAMRDAGGTPIVDCLEPHIQQFNGTYYAYGFTVRNESEQFATTIYSSEDLRSWTRRAYVPTDPALDGSAPQDAVALWYVLYNRRTRLYVGYGASYGHWINVYTSPSPVGPFVFRRRLSSVFPYSPGIGAGDILVFGDDGGDDAYLVFNSMHANGCACGACACCTANASCACPLGDCDVTTRFTFIYKFTEDWTDILPSTLCNTTVSMEGLWMVKRKGTYFLFGSPLVGYGVADNFYLTSSSPLGPWTYQGLFAPAHSNTYNSQTFQGLTVSGSKGTVHVFIGHRWGSPRPPFPNASNIWLPLQFGGHHEVAQMLYYDEWELDTDGSWSASSAAGGGAAQRQRRRRQRQQQQQPTT